MSNVPWDEWRVGDNGMVVVLAHGERPELNNLSGKVVEKHEPGAEFGEGSLTIQLQTTDKRLPTRVTLPTRNVFPLHPIKPIVQETFMDPAKFFEVAMEGNMGRGIRATQDLANGMHFDAEGDAYQFSLLMPESRGRRFASSNYSGVSSENNTDTFPKKTRRMAEKVHSALHGFEKVIRNGVIPDDQFCMVCTPKMRYNGELCNVGGCYLCGADETTLAALKSINVSKLDEPAEDPATALLPNFDFCRKRAQFVNYLVIVEFVKEGLGKIPSEDTARREAWVSLVWHTVFVWTNNAFVQRNPVMEIFTMENRLRIPIDDSTEHSLRTNVEEIHYLDLQDQYASPADKKRIAAKRALFRSRIATIEAEKLARETEFERAKSFHPVLQQAQHVTKHSHWVSLINGAQSHDIPLVNVALVHGIRNPSQQRQFRYPEDFKRGFCLTKAVKKGDFLRIAYNEPSVTHNDMGYFADCGNSIREQAFAIPAVLDELNSFLVLHKKHMPDYVYDYLLLSSELATRAPAGFVPQPNLELDYTVREPIYRGPPAL